MTKNTYMKMFPISIILKIKNHNICYFTPIRLTKISLTIPSARENVKQEKVSYTDNRNTNWKGKHFEIAW